MQRCTDAGGTACAESDWSSGERLLLLSETLITG